MLEEELRDDARATPREIRLRADVPVGAYLSGGLDSSTLVALLKERVPDTLQTFSIGFDDAGLDESAHQRTVAEHLQTPCTTTCSVRSPTSPRVSRAPSATPRARCCAPRPRRCSCCRGLVRRSDVKVVLTGEGADEVLGGYDIFKESKVRQFWAQQPGLDVAARAAQAPVSVPRPHVRAERGLPARNSSASASTIPTIPCFSHLPRWATTAQCKLFWSDDLRAQVAGIGRRAAARRRCRRRSRRWHPFNRAEYLEARTLLPSYLLSSQGDRMLMANSVEGRFPFLDHRLIEFANQLHPALQDARAAREAPAQGNHARAAAGSPSCKRHKQPYRAPDAAAFLGRSAPEYVNELIGRIARAPIMVISTRTRSRAWWPSCARRRCRAARDNMAFVGVLSTQLWHAQFVAGETALEFFMTIELKETHMSDALTRPDPRFHPRELSVHHRHLGAGARRLAARPRHRRFHRHARDHLLHRRAARREGEGRGNDSRQPRLA